MPTPLTIFGQEIIDANAIEQMKNCLTENSIGVLTADAHYGYGHPIGGVVGYKDKISLSGVGFDIACGNKAVMTNLMAKDIDTPKIMTEIVRQIGFGVGRPNPKPIDHPVFDKIAKAEFQYQRELLTLAREQLGTVGGGNHFIDLFEDEEGRLWIGVHFGSRGFGFKTTMGFIAISQGKSFRAKVQEGPMNEPPILFDAASESGIDYVSAIQLAGEYAYAGRNVVVDKVVEILGATILHEVHIHHNFAWREEHFGEKYWVVRKGSTPAFPSQQGFVGASMGDSSVIIEGIDSDKSKQALYSTIHGAGRIMSRRKAAGKKRWKRGRLVRDGDGVVNFDAVKAQLKEKGIVLRGGAADEAPEVYKKLDEVLSYHEGTIKVLHHLRPIGVAMADDRSYDPYKD